MTMTEDRMAYVGSLACGCIVSAVVDNPEHRKFVARTVAEMVREGEIVTRRLSSELNADPAFLRICGGPLHRTKSSPATRHRQQPAPGSAVRTD